MISEQATQVAIEAARAGGEVLRSTFNQELDTDLKDARANIVTSADKQSQDAVVAVIRRAFPDHLVVGEEGTTGEADAEYAWYVDPLDGTSNYANGIPYFCTSVALCHGSEIMTGVVYDPYHDDLFVAARGAGATRNGVPLRVSSVDRLDRAIVVAQAQSDDPAVIHEFAELVERLMNVSRGLRFPGAPALVLCSVAAGQYASFCERYMDPWDIVAGQLILEEAGGRLTDFDGRPPEWPRVSDIVASNGHLHDALLDVLRQAPPG